MAYRDRTEIPCPRCKRRLTGADICRDDCGTWVSSLAATIVFTPEEIAPNLALRWWRRREPCPLCEEQMVLRGSEPGLFQGCNLHGFWIDADTVEHTGLARGIDEAALQRLRDDHERVDAHREHTDQLAVTRAHEHEAAVQREARVAKDVAALAARSIADTAKLTDGLVDGVLDAVTDTSLHRKTRRLEDRVEDLERKNAGLEARIAAIEAALTGNASQKS
jgi:hypothetical protein